MGCSLSSKVYEIPENNILQYKKNIKLKTANYKIKYLLADDYKEELDCIFNIKLNRLFKTKQIENIEDIENIEKKKHY